MTLLQQALEALEKANKSCNCGHEWMSHTPTCRHLVCSTAIDALRTAIAQAGQPIGWQLFCNGAPCTWEPMHFLNPTLWADVNGMQRLRDFQRGSTDKYEFVPLYTHPQAAKPLSGEQLRDIARTFKANTKWRLEEHWDEIVSFVREVEAAHNIKEQQP